MVKTIKSHFNISILTFPHLLNQDEHFFIAQTAANMLVNATYFKLSSECTLWKEKKNKAAFVSTGEISVHTL
jgi:hypothetical protein